MARILVGMSGGVDSSVAASLLLEQGHEVVGATLRLGIAELHGRQCCGEEAAADARRVAEALGIPHVVVDASERFASFVAEPFAEEYARGRTPNPCVVCNEQVKFALLLERAEAFGCDAIATGHFARTVADARGRRLVARAADARKDQSYFLYRLSDETLARTLFPLGWITKAEVRRRACAIGLPVAGRSESQEVCFTEDHAGFVASRRPGALTPGPIETLDGEVIGEHSGIARFTVGQRKGLGLGGGGGPWRVVRVDAERNAVVVAQGDALAARAVELSRPVWRVERDAARCEAVVRYRATPAPCRARFDGERIVVEFDAPVEATAPGQSVVLYDGDAVIGGGVMERVER